MLTIQLKEKNDNLVETLKSIKGCAVESIGNFIYITYNDSILLNSISKMLSEYIIEKYEDILINRIINDNCAAFLETEKKDIYQKALYIIKNQDKNFFNSLFAIKRKNIIQRKLTDYFISNDKIIIEGFVNFSLKEYQKDLEDIVDKAVDDFLMDREYAEFIRLLRYFVSVQECKKEVVYVKPTDDNKYILMDETEREITNECIQEYINEIAEGEVNYDDLLISSLITLAPKKIILENEDQWKNKELIKTIKEIFADREDVKIKPKKVNLQRIK